MFTNGWFSLLRSGSASADEFWLTLGVEPPRRALAEIKGQTVDVAADHLSLCTTAALALDEISTLDRQRPQVSGDFSVAEVEELVRHPIMRYSAGVGAKRRVLDPWRRHIAVYRQRISELNAFWSRAVRPHVAALEETDPLAFLLRPLLLLTNFSHDEDIRAEHEARIDRLSADVEHLAGRVGAVFGFLAVLVGFYSLPIAAGVGAVAVAYFYGLVEVVHLFRRLRRRAPKSAWPPLGTRLTPRLAEVASRLPTKSSGVLVGKYLAVIDFACAFRLWVELLDRFPDLQHPLTDEPTESPEVTWIAVGGPLSVPARRELPDPVCELAPTDAVFSDWGYVSGGTILCVDGQDDTIGCVAASESGSDVIYVDGFRSVGVEAATQWLLNALEDSGIIDGLSWSLVRYSGKGERIEVLVSV